MKNTRLALLGFLLLTTPLAATAQQFGDFTYTSDGITITITGYTGPGGDVAIPASINGRPVRTIEGSAFYQTTNPTSVTIPVTVTSIEGGAFSSCPGMVVITVAADNPTYSSLDGVLFNKSQTTLIQYPGGKAGSYVIPSSVTNIADLAFTFCANLTSVNIPASVISIGGDAFTGSGLTSVTIPGSITDTGWQAFSECGSLTSVTLLNGVSSIGGDAFWDCSNLTSVTIPGSVIDIAPGAFGKCTSLTNITIPGSVISIGGSAFEQCTSLKGVFFKGNSPGTDPVFSPFAGDPAIVVYYLPGAIGWGATYGGVPTKLWNPLMQSSGVGPAGFGFNITGTEDIPIVIEAAPSLANPAWVPLQSLNLTNGAFYFSDPNWTNYPARFYRIRSP